MDLKHLERYNSRIRYLLVVTGVYSRYVWVKKLCNKESDRVAHKFEEIVDNEGVLPDVIHSDKGGEFSLIKNKCKNGLFGKVVRYYSNENYEMKSMIIERFIQTL